MIRRQLVIIVAALALLGTLGLLTMTAPAEDATPAGVVAHQGQLSPSGDSADGVVEVVVVDDAGAPIPGATVTVTGTGTGTGTGLLRQIEQVALPGGPSSTGLGARSETADPLLDRLRGRRRLRRRGLRRPRGRPVRPR